MTNSIVGQVVHLSSYDPTHSDIQCGESGCTSRAVWGVVTPDVTNGKQVTIRPYCTRCYEQRPRMVPGTMTLGDWLRTPGYDWDVWVGEHYLIAGTKEKGTLIDRKTGLALLHSIPWHHVAHSVESYGLTPSTLGEAYHL